ncbi:MAG: MFS transporter [Actinomycetes bacterium]
MAAETSSPAKEGGLTRPERRIVIGVSIAVAATFTVMASFNYMLNPMLEDLGLTSEDAGFALQLPNLAAILVVFSAGVLGDRLGQRRVITFAAIAFIVGSVLVACAPAMPVITVGLLVEGVGASAITIVALGLLSSRIEEPGARASAFAAFGAVNPLVYLVIPLAAGIAVHYVTWRMVPLLWAVFGVLALAATRKLLPTNDVMMGTGELATPLLAGIAVMAGVQWISWTNNLGIANSQTLAALVVTLLALAATAITYRRAKQPSLALGVLRKGAMPVLLIIVLLAPFANLWFYMMLAFQHVYGLNAVETAVVMLPAQVTGVLGAVIARALLARKGVTWAGTILLIAVGISLLLTLTVRQGSPVWVPALVVALFSATAIATSVPLTNAVMDSAGPNESGSASAMRGAAGSIGAALGVVLMGSVVFGAVQANMVDEIAATGQPPQKAASMVAELEAASQAPNPASPYPIPAEEEEFLKDAFARSMLNGIYADGVVGAGIAFASAGLFFVSRRKQRQQPGG